MKVINMKDDSCEFKQMDFKEVFDLMHNSDYQNF